MTNMSSVEAAANSENIGNIGNRGTRQRRVIGAIGVAAAAGLLFWLVEAEASRWLRLSVFPVLWFGAVGLLQARARTCIALAARGTCDPDAGVPEMTTELDRVFRARAKSITRFATLVSAILTLLALLIA